MKSLGEQEHLKNQAQRSNRSVSFNFKSIEQRLVSTTEKLLALIVISAVVLNFANILGRYVFSRAIVGAEEILIYQMVAIVFLGTIVVTLKDSHLRMSMLVDVASTKARAAMRRLEWFILALVTGFVSWIASNVSLQMRGFGQKSLIADIPMWLPHGVIALGLGASAAIGFWFFLAKPKEIKTAEDE
ncbi:MAG: TRAP transporter small permease [Pseudomonadota bacterium]